MTLFVNTNPQPIDIPGSRFAAGDVPPTTYTRRASPGQAGTKVTLRGLSLRALLEQNGVDPDSISFVNIIRGDGSQVTIPQADIADPPPFPEGPALITDDGATTRFFRPVRGRYATNAKDEVYATAATGGLQIYVDGGDVSVVASVDRPTVSAGRSVTFSASVRYSPPGAQLTFEWDFGDGSPPQSGKRIKHVYEVGGNYQARVSARGTGGTTQRCATYCAGTDAVDVTVGAAPERPTTTVPNPGSGTGDPNAPGSSAGTGGGGQGGSGGSSTGTGTGATSGKAKAKPKAKKPPPPPPKKPFGVTISGVLIDDTGATVRKLPAGEPAGAPRGPREAAGGDSDRTLEIPLAGLAAFAVFSLGALRERRGVKLRIA